MSKRLTAKDLEARELVNQRSDGKCERCGVDLFGQMSSIHHRKPRGMGGTSQKVHRVENMVVLCGSGTTGCHGWVESNRNQARADGWLIRNLDDINEPVLSHTDGWIALTTVGTKNRVYESGVKQ